LLKRESGNNLLLSREEERKGIYFGERESERAREITYLEKRKRKDLS